MSSAPASGKSVMARILVIDDEELIRTSIRLILETNGYDVVEAENGEDGIERQRETPFDVVITDILMPGKEGIETIIELKRDYKDLKIIAISGGARTINIDYLELAKEFGADNVLPKPFLNVELLQCVEECLNLKEPW